MSTTRIGTTTHELLYNFETAHQRFTRMGIDDHQAKRMAMIMTLRLTGSCNGAEAVEITDEILGKKATDGQ